MDSRPVGSRGGDGRAALVSRNTIIDYSKLMVEAMTLAEKGRGMTLSNPLVGAVIIDDGGNIIGKGYHESFGGPHAEINAISSATKDITGKTMICTLEPCNHSGKTGPCTEAIIKAGIKKVIIGALDPHSRVGGRGLRRLARSGIDVSFGIKSHEILKQNAAYVKFIETGMPLITMKIAMSSDGKITDAPGKPAKITGILADGYVHSLRSRVDGIITGIGTVLSDDPLLTVRLGRNKRQPARFIIDTNARLPLESEIVKTADKIKTFLIVGMGADEHKLDRLKRGKIQVVDVAKDKSGIVIGNAMKEIAGLGYIDLMIEAGQKINSAFLKQNLVDKIELLVSKQALGANGLTAFDSEASELFNKYFEIYSEKDLGSDKHISGRMTNVHRVG